jgi:hypothetical protein
VKTAILTIRKEPHYRRAAFESMLLKHGYAIVNQSLGAAPKSKEDLLILWNKKRGNEEAEANRWEKQGGTVLIVENGYLQPVDKTYYAISVHGHNGSGWFPVGPEDRFRKLGFEMRPRGRETGYHLVCGQRGIGSSLMASPPQWAERTAKKLEAAGLKTKLRLHPGNFAPKVSLLDDLKGAVKCHIWSSASGVRALVEGIPVAHYAPHWICDMRDRGRLDALHRMSHGQWHYDEIATGEPLVRILAHLGEASWG